MKQVKILGTGCANCRHTLALVEQVAREKGVPIELEKVETLPEILRYGVMSTPGVVIDGQVVHAGGVPERAAVDALFESVRAGCGAGASDRQVRLRPLRLAR